MEKCASRLQQNFSTEIKRIDDPYSNIVHYLYSEREIFEKIANHIKETFNIEITFDNLEQGEKAIRIKPEKILETFHSKQESAKFWRENSPTLQNQGDGLKAYLKILFTLFNPSKEIIIIDEPETFLHPPQRRSLGKFIAENISDQKQIFISTHDSEFLRGIIINTTETKIFHLKNKNTPPEYSTHEEKTESKKRSQSNNELILNAYFNKLTILCEAEDDRMVYQYASQKFFPAENVDIHFVGLNGKTEVFANFKVLKDLKINVAAITDIDILHSGEHVQFITDDKEKKELIILKNKLNALEIIQKTLLKKNGPGAIPEQKNDIESAIEIMEKYKIYINPIGELEAFLDKSKATDRKVQNIKNNINQNSENTNIITLKGMMQRVVK